MGGAHLRPGSRGSRLSHTEIRNTVAGVTADSLSQVAMLNCRLRNSAGYVMRSIQSEIELTGCELAEAADGVLYLRGGKAQVSNCTFANYYLFVVPRGAAIQLDHFNADTDNKSGMPLLEASIVNSIIYGLGSDLSDGDLTGSAVTLRRCLLKSNGSDDDNFIDCLWEADPLYNTVRNDYYFDYRLQEGSPAIGAALPELIPADGALDIYGTPASPPPTSALTRP